MLKKRKREEKEKNLIKLAGILGKNAFTLKISENLAKCRSKNNLVKSSKYYNYTCRILTLIARMLKLFVTLLIVLEFPT